MAITWDQARTKLRGRLWKTGTSGLPDGECDAALHAAVLQLEAERQWLWLENIKTSSALVTASNEIALPSDFSAARSLCFRRSATAAIDPPLQQIPLGRVRVLASPGITMGAPAYYAIQGGNIFLNCKAPAGAIMELVYTARTPEDLDAAVAAGDSNQTLQKQQTAVIALGGHYVSLNFLRNDAEATRKLAVYQGIVNRLIDIEDEQRGDLHGGCIVPDNTYQFLAEGY